MTSRCSHGTAIAVTVWTIRPDVHTSVYMSVCPAHSGPVTARHLPEPSVTAWDDYTSLNAHYVGSWALYTALIYSVICLLELGNVCFYYYASIIVVKLV